jgi:hypothetical protein
MDVDCAEQICAAYRQATGLASDALIREAERHAAAWVRGHRDAIMSFTRQLTACRFLSGQELQERLGQTFGEPTQHILLGTELRAWLHTVKAERKAAQKAEKEAARRKQAARAADTLALYTDIMYPVREKRSEEPKQSRSQLATPQVRVAPNFRLIKANNDV